jgi:two-component system invasion response regulator UvrY
MIRVMLVDDHAVVRVGFRMLLADAGIDVVAEAADGEAACQLYPTVRPDLVVMDLSMPGMGGIEAVRRLLAQDGHTRVLALSAYEDTAHPRRALRAGALGYLCKRSAPDELILAVKTVARGERYVFIQLARGLSVVQIAENLKLSPSTVGTHLYHVKQKLGAGNQSELTLAALHWGLMES